MGDQELEFAEKWRDNAYGCFSSGHKFCREVCPVMQVTRNENHTPTAFHASIVAMEKGLVEVEDVADDFVHCTQCGACELRCPNTLFTGDFYRHRTRTVDVVKAMRALMVDTGNEQAELEAVERAARAGPQRAGARGRPRVARSTSRTGPTAWTSRSAARRSCSSTARPRSTAPPTRARSRSSSRRAGYEFGLMREQWCCGGPAAEMGYRDLALKHAKHNVEDWRAVGAKRIIAPDPHDFIAFTEDYPKYFPDDYEFEIVLGIELVNDLVKDGRIELTHPVERTVTYHDPCRLNKRKGVHEAPRELIRAIPGITFKDVDRVTQWSYCSGGGGGLPIEKPEITAEISKRRVAKAAELEVDTLISACPWSERPLSHRRARGQHRRDGPVRAARDQRGDRAVSPRRLQERRRRPRHRRAPGDHRRRRPRPRRPELTRLPVPRPRAVPGAPLGRALPGRRDPPEDRASRSPRWSSSPTATRSRSSRAPAAPGLSDGAVPLRGGIMIDCKLMNQIHEIDLVDRTVTVGPGINMLKLNEELKQHGVIYPDDPASYPCSLVGGRIGTGGWSLLGSRYGHTRDLVISMEVVLPTGEIVEIAEGGGRKLRKSSTGLTLKQLFTGHQGTLGITTQATLELVPRPEVEFAAFFAFDDYMKAWETTGILTKSGLATIAGVVLFDEHKIKYLRRDDEAYIPQPDSVRAVVAVGDVRPQDRGRAGRPRRSCGSGAATPASTSATRSPPATGRPATTATRRRCTAATSTARPC